MCGFSCTKAEKQQLVFRQAKPRDLPDIKRMVRKDRCYATVRVRSVSADCACDLLTQSFRS